MSTIPNTPIPATVHIHQGGTMNAYCGIPLSAADVVVAWEDADQTDCKGCASHFAPKAEVTLPGEKDSMPAYFADRFAGK